MKKILIVLLTVVCASVQAQFIQNRAAFIARDSVSSPVYNKGTDTIPSTDEVASQIYDSLQANGITPPNSDILYWNTSLGAYELHESAADGLLSREAGTYSTNEYSTMVWGGVSQATKFQASNSGIGAFAGQFTTSNSASSSVLATNSGGGVGVYAISNTAGGVALRGVSSQGNILKCDSATTTRFLVTNEQVIVNGTSGDSAFSVNCAADFTEQIAMTGLESNLGEYQLTLNPTTGEVYADEIPHGFFAFEDSARGISLASNATWYQVTNSEKTLWGDFESEDVSISGDTMSITHTGHYEIHYHVVFTANSGVWFKMRMYNVTQAEAIPIKTAATGNGSNKVSIGNTAYCTNCNAGDKIIMQVIAESNSQTFTVEDGSILIKATHGE